MFDISLGELLIVGAVGVLVTGPDNIHENLRSAAKMFRAFRKYTNNFKEQLTEYLDIDDDASPRVRKKFITGDDGKKYLAYETDDAKLVSNSKKQDFEKDNAEKNNSYNI